MPQSEPAPRVGGGPNYTDSAPFSAQQSNLPRPESIAGSLGIHLRVLENMTEGVSVADGNGFIAYTNPAEDRMFGYEPGELIGQHVTVQNAYAPEENERIVAEVIRELHRSGAWRGEWRNRRKDGTEFLTRARITAVEIDGATWMVCVQEDITEQRQASQRLEQSEERLRAFVEATSDLVWTTDVNGMYVEPQPSWEAFTGQKWPEYTGAGARSAIHADDVARLVAEWTESISSQRSFEIEYRLWHARGQQYRHVVSRAIPVKNPDGTLREWVGTVTDIHERRVAEAARRSSEHQLRSLISASPIPIVVLTATGEVTVWNSSAERVFGWSEEEVLGKPLPFIPTEKRAEHIDMRQRDLTGSGFVNREIRRIRKDGSPIDLLVSTAPIRDETGRVRHIMSVYMDITERKRMESELRESDQRFRTLTQAMPALVWTADPEGRVDYSNDSWLNYTGQSLEQTLGFGWLDAVHPDDHARISALWTSRLASGEQYEIGYRIRSFSDGEWRWHLARCLPLKDSAGRVTKWIGTATDIHDQVEAAERLRRSEERFRSLFKQSPVPLWESDWSGALRGLELLRNVGVSDFGEYFRDNGEAADRCLRQVRLLETNRAALDLAGAPDQQTLLVRDLTDLVAPESADAVADLLSAVAERRTQARAELFVVTLSGEQRHVICDFAVVPGHEKTFDRVVLTFTDTTDRKIAEEALRRSETYFRELADRAPSMLWLTDPSGSCTYLNQRWCEFTGVPVEGGLGAGWLSTVHPEDAEAVAASFGAANAARLPFTFDCRVLRADGVWRWVVDSGEPRFGADGEFLGYIGTVTDITERKLAEEELRARNEELRYANSELEEFAYVASHDLQEPLRTVNIFSELLLRKYPVRDAGEAEKYVHFIQGGVRRMEVLIQDLLAYSRSVHTLKALEDPGAADLNAALADSLTVLHERLVSTGAKVRSDRLPVVCAEVSQISQVFQNLLSNSLKYCRQGVVPDIEITARANNGRWVIAVRDNGIGFDAQYSDRVFGLFKRLHRDQYPGTGLGLAICKRIVERFGGRIWVESEPDRGSVFFFELASPSAATD